VVEDVVVEDVAAVVLVLEVVVEEDVTAAVVLVSGIVVEDGAREACVDVVFGAFSSSEFVANATPMMTTAAIIRCSVFMPEYLRFPA
jgi:hypothetical protein